MTQSHPASYGEPPPPPPLRNNKGCLKVAAIGCGGLLVLFILAVAASALWLNRNKEEIGAGMEKGVAEGQRFGAGTDEAGCEAETKRRALSQRSVTGQMGLGAFFRACLQSSRETPGYCENVPRPTAIRRSAEWRTARCGSDAGCAAIAPVIQTYCADNRPKHPGLGDSTAVRTPVDSAGADSTTF